MRVIRTLESFGKLFIKPGDDTCSVSIATQKRVVLSSATEGFLQERIMAVGWSRDGGVQKQIDAGVEDAVKLARSRLPEGAGLTHCEACETAIPDARRKAIPGVRRCVNCQSEIEKKQTTPTGFNRRGSKDSQLK